MALRTSLEDELQTSALAKAARLAERPELATELTEVLDKAARRDSAACETLLAHAALLLRFLRSPRGRAANVATMKHELLLDCLHELGRPRRFTRNAYVDDFTDVATQATRVATGNTTFDPRHACGRLKRWRPATP
jgi:hypothetical protein